MPLASYVQSSFLGGELSQSAQGRIDRPDYRTALNVCLNSLPIEAGAWLRRSGSRFAAATKAGVDGRVIPFTFKQRNPYMLEFTDGFLRYYSGYELAKTNDALAVVSISAATPAKVLTATHGWATGNTVMFSVLGVNNPLLHNRQFLITVTSATEFTLADALTGDAIVGSALGTFVSGTVSRILTTSTVYTGGSWSTLRSVQAETNAVLLHGGFKPYVLSVATQPTDSAYATFTLAAANFQDGPYFDPFTNGVLATPSALTGVINLTLSFNAYSATKAYSVGDYVTSSSVTYVSLTDSNVGNTPVSSPASWSATSAGTAIGANGFVGTDIGRHVRLYSEPPLWVVGGTYTTGNSVSYVDSNGNTAYYTALANTTGALANAPGVSLTSWGLSTAGARWTWGRITGFLNVIDRMIGAAIGDMTGGGGLAAAFDNVTDQAASASATKAGSNVTTITGYVGRNYTAASDQAIASATIYWPNNLFTVSGGNSQTGRFPGLLSPITTIPIDSTVTVHLRGKASVPASATDGTLLGTYGPITNPTLPANIISSDQATAWKYVWVEIIIDRADLASGVSVTSITTAGAAELQLFNPPGTGSSTGVSVQIVGDDLLYTTAVRTWRLGLYSGTQGWPTCGTYHEGRLWVSGSVNNRVDASEPLDTNRPGFLVFRPTLPNGAVTAAQAISYTLRSPQTNTILWMEPDLQGIIVGTEAGEWLVQSATNDGPITPLSIKARRVTKIGCANILPAKTEHTTVFVQRYKHKTMEYFPDVYSGKFAAPNLAAMAKHLTTRGLEELAYQQELTPIVWARCTDGSLIGTTYKRESLISSQGPTFAGWHRHELGSDRTVTSIAGGPATDGLLDTLAMVTADSTGGVRHVEFMANLWEETNDETLDGWFLDNAVVPTATQNATVSGVACLQCFGAWHLAGKTVSVTVGGLDVGDYVVTSEGLVNIPYGVADGIFTTAYVTALGSDMSVVIGYSYTSDGQMVRPALQQESGTRAGPGLGKVRRNHLISPLLVTTQGISFGTEFTTGKMNMANFETPGGTRYAQNRLFTGIFNVALTDSPSRDGMICWRITRPYPAMISAMPVSLETVDQ